MPSGDHRPLRTTSWRFSPSTVQRALATLALLALLATACRVDASDMSAVDRSAAAGQDTSQSAGTPSSDAGAANTPSALRVSDITCRAPSLGAEQSGLNSQGEQMFDRYLQDDPAVPTYELVVDIDPSTGHVAGAMRAEVPTPDQILNFRVFAGMDAFDADLSVRNVVQNGSPSDFVLDRALLSLPAAASPNGTTTIELDFDFTVDQMAANENLFGALTGQTLQPDQVGLLGRTETGMQLGHWFPVWLPDGIRTDPDPSGFGDIGAFPTANICATVTVPSGFQTITGGSRVTQADTSITEAGAGLRDFAILISNDLAASTTVVDGVSIHVWGPSNDVEARTTVLDFAEKSQQALTAAFGSYPWTEIDLVAAPLGGGVGGMEWPGMIWVEQSLFAGGLPGMGQFGDLLDDETMESLLGGFGGEALSTTLEWTVAHELGHEWWHATVGNDSIASPAVDEPLAQFAACIAMIEIHPDNWRDICEAQTTGQFAQARSLGIADTAAEQPSDAFDSAIQYGAIVYGKAPGFYLQAADLIGWDQLVDALRSFIADNAFDLVSTDDLRSHLVEAAGDDGDAIGALWDRWFRQAKGDEDIETADLFGDLGLEGFDLEGLDLEGLEDLNIEELFEGIENLDLEDLDLDELLGENAELFDELLESLTEQGTN